MKRRFPRLLLLVFALAGILNCIALQPALALQEETHCTDDTRCDDCFLCCSFHHQTILVSSMALAPEKIYSHYIAPNHPFLFDSPSFSIFHPPLAR